MLIKWWSCPERRGIVLPSGGHFPSVESPPTLRLLPSPTSSSPMQQGLAGTTSQAIPLLVDILHLHGGCGGRKKVKQHMWSQVC